MALSVYDLTIDTNLALKTAGLVGATASGASLTGGVAYVDIGGAANSYQRFGVVIDWTACEVANGDERYTVIVQGCDSTAFSTVYRLEEREFGDSSVTGNAVDTPPAGRHVLWMDNFAHTSATDGNSFTTCRYIRLSVVVAGTVATGMNLTAYVVPLA